MSTERRDGGFGYRAVNEANRDERVHGPTDTYSRLPRDVPTMRRDALQVGSLALLLVLAGCAMPFLGGQSTPTATPVPLSPTPTPALDPAAPPGVTPGGIDADALLSAHVEALSSTTYTFRTVRGGNASSVTRYERALVSPTAQLRVRRQVANGTEVGNTTQFVNATAAYRRVSDETRRYIINERPEPPEPRTGRYALESFLDAANVSVAGTRVRDGTPVVVFRVTSPDAFRSLPEERTLVGIDATLAVDADGVVRNFSYTATIERPGGVDRLTYRHRVTDVGTTTVTRPSWLRKPQFVDRTVESVEFYRSDWESIRSKPVLNASVSPFVAADTTPAISASR
jgi:hypothetical protein